MPEFKRMLHNALIIIAKENERRVPISTHA